MSKKDPIQAQCLYTTFCCKCGKHHYDPSISPSAICYLPYEYEVYQYATTTNTNQNTTKLLTCLCKHQKLCDCPWHKTPKTTEKASGFDEPHRNSSGYPSSIVSVPRYSQNYDQISNSSSECCCQICPRCSRPASIANTPATNSSVSKMNQICPSLNTICAANKSNCPTTKASCPSTNASYPTTRASGPTTKRSSPSTREISSSPRTNNSPTELHDEASKLPSIQSLSSNATSERVCTCFKELQTVDEEIMVAPLMDTKEVMVIDSATKLKRLAKLQNGKPAYKSGSLENVDTKCCKCNKPFKHKKHP